MKNGDDRLWPTSTKVVNTYGPAECTCVCAFEVRDQRSSKSISFGYGVGAAIWVVDTNNSNQLTPIGAVGELYVEGPIVGEGYLNDKKKTAATFIENPSWLIQGGAGYQGRQGRLYKTGDLVRYHEDGSLTYVARKDTQVKIRGQRVELGEVESHAQACIPDAKQVVAEVIVPDGDNAEPILVAFVVSNNNRSEPKASKHPTDIGNIKISIPSATIEEALTKRLPSYMVPTLLISIDDIPLNSSGKTDRKKLREIGAGFKTQQLVEIGGSSTEKRSPSTNKERILQQIWAQLFNLDPMLIYANDHFFRLGGNSITAMKLVVMARNEGFNIAVPSIFRNPRLSSLASQMTTAQSGLANGAVNGDISPFSILAQQYELGELREEAGAACEVDPVNIMDAYPCTPLQEGLLAMTSLSPNAYIRRNIQELAIGVDLSRFRDAWTEAVRRLAILRTRIIQHSQYGLLQVVVNENITWTNACDLQEYLEEDSKTTISLGQRLARYALVSDSTSSRTWFVWTIHHTIYDGHFLGNLNTLITHLYQSFSTDAQPSLLDFKLFVKYMATIDSNETMAYWRDALAGYEAEPFPPAPPKMSQANDMETKYDILEYRCTLDRIIGREVTLTSYIRAAWALTVAAASGTDDVVFGAVISGRHADIVGVDSIAGPTIASVPVRIKVAPTQRVEEFLQTVQQQSTDMIAYEQAGLQYIQKASPDAWRACHFQTLLLTQPPDNPATTDEDGIGTWETGNGNDSHNFTSYTLTLNGFQDTDGGVAMMASFNTQYLSGHLMGFLLERFAACLRQLIGADVSHKLSEIDALSASDYDQIWSWNANVPDPVDRTVHSFIEQQVADRPNAVAVHAWDGDFTYRELDSFANSLATRLISLGVSTDTIVPLCFEKSRWTAVSVLAVLKAGGAFTLLDPSQPLSRLRGSFSPAAFTLKLRKMRLANRAPTDTCLGKQDNIPGTLLDNPLGNVATQASGTTHNEISPIISEGFPQLHRSDLANRHKLEDFL
ncbi:hypothetical protein TruAng_009992 [Truncatella angustata]|nr:hypothetical protein TruAng_009992 [Truncatella angustata]